MINITDDIIDDMPENYPLIKDSGAWMLASENMNEILLQQNLNETFFDFITRCISEYGTDGFEI